MSALPKVFTVTGLLTELNSDGTVLSRNGLYDLLDTGTLKGFKVGSEWRITQPAVLEWMGVPDAENDSEGVEPPTAVLESVDFSPVLREVSDG